MDSALITLILNIGLLVFVVFGFLLGLRGLKKATSGLITFIVTMLIVFFISPAISRLLLNINISGDTIYNHISNAVISAIGEDMAKQEIVASIIDNIPLMIVNIVTTILLLIVVGLICKIIGAIVYKIIFKNDKVKEVEKCEIVNGSPQMVKVKIKPKKHRLLGGMVGAVKGLLVCFALFMPLIGFANIFSDIAGVNDVSAETATEGTELKSINELLKENLPVEVYDSLEGVNDSILSKLGRIGNIGEASLNVVSSCNLNGQTIRLGQEIRALCGTYDKFVDFTKSSSSDLINTNIEDIFTDLAENPNNYDFNKLYEVIDELFNSKIIVATGNDILVLAIDMWQDSTTDESLTKYLTHLQKAVNSYSKANFALKDDFKALIETFEISAKSGLLKVAQSEEFKIQDVIDVLLNEADETNNKPKNEVLNNLALSLTKSNLLQKVVIESANYGIGELELLINDNLTLVNTTNISLKSIDSSESYKISATELSNLVLGLCDTVDALGEMDEEKLNEDFLNIFDYNVESALENIGKTLQTIADMSIFNDTGVFDSLCDAMSSTDINNYVSFSALKGSDSIKSQFQNISNAVREFKNSGVLESIKGVTEENTNDRIGEIITKLATTYEDKTYARRIVTPLLECSVAENTLKYGLDQFNYVLQDFVITLNDQITLAEFNYDDILSTERKAETLTLLDNIINFASEVEVTTLTQEDMLDVIIDKGLISLGTALDSAKNSKLFGVNNNNESAYIDFISALQSSDLSDVLYFETAKQESFSWSNNMTTLKNLVDSLNTIQIEEQGLVNYMINGGDYNKIMDALSKEDASKLKPLFDNMLLAPMATNIVNEINTAISDFVGEEFNKKIVMLDAKNPIDYSSQSQEIIDIIAEAINVDLSSLDFDNLTDEQIDQINMLLSKLKINALNEGVFKESYNALLLKMATIIVTEIQELVGDNLKDNVNPNLSDFDINSESDVIADNNQLIVLLNTLLNNINTIKNTELTKINPTTLISVLDEFNNSQIILNGYFKQPFNVLLVHIINEINGELSSIVGTTFSSNIEIYKGTTDMITEYDYIKPLITRTFDILAEDTLDVTKLDKTKLINFLDALSKCDYTENSYVSLLSYISNEIIRNVNTLIGSNNAELTSPQEYISTQEDDIVNILTAVNDAESIIDEKGVKISDLTSEERVKLATLLNEFQTNARKSSGVFRNTYNSLVDYVEEENGTSGDLIKEQFSNESGVIDWENFVNQLN